MVIYIQDYLDRQRALSRATPVLLSDRPKIHGTLEPERRRVVYSRRAPGGLARFSRSDPIPLRVDLSALYAEATLI